MCIRDRFYPEATTFGKGIGRYAAWGVFESPFDEGTSYADRMRNRYLPAGVLDENFNISDPDESKITEYVGHSWYEGDADLPPFEQDTKPAFTEYDVNDRYTWDKCPLYDGKSLETGSFARVLVAYKPVSYTHLDVYKRQKRGMGSRSGVHRVRGRP